MGAWKPDREEATFLGEVLVIDAKLAGICADQLRKGVRLQEVRATLDYALKIAKLAGASR